MWSSRPSPKVGSPPSSTRAETRGTEMRPGESTARLRLTKANFVISFNGVKTLRSVMQPEDRRAKEKAELRGKILEAARFLFVRHGFEAVTMRKIARRIGYTATALYYHFPDKRALLRELCETDYGALRQSFKRLEKVLDPTERIRRMAQAYVHFGLEHPQHYRLMFMTPYPQDSPKTTERGNPDQDAYAFLLQTVRECVHAGRLRQEYQDGELVAQALWGAMHGLIALHLTFGGDDEFPWRPPVKTAESLCQALLRGFFCCSDEN
jgi:AcrR family transcriptional regulator